MNRVIPFIVVSVPYLLPVYTNLMINFKTVEGNLYDMHFEIGFIHRIFFNI